MHLKQSKTTTLLTLFAFTTISLINCKGTENFSGTISQQSTFVESEPHLPPPMDFQGDSLHRPPMGTPPNGGPPPMGMPPGGMPPEGMGMNESPAYNSKYEIKNTKSINQQTIQATDENQSAILGKNNARITLADCRINTSGTTTSNDQSSFYGLNAAVLAIDSSSIESKNNVIITTGQGANGIFSCGPSFINSENDTIDCTAGGGHGIMASGGGTIHAKHIYMITRGRNSGAIATDRGSGIITVDHAEVLTTGSDSPGIYSTGKITVDNANIEASGSEVAVIEGSNSIVTNYTNLTCSFCNKWGVMIYQSFSGDAEGIDGHFEMNNGSLYSRDSIGPLFFVTNSNANIYLNNVAMNNASGIFLSCKASRWGNKGTNGGKANIFAHQQKFEGIIKADAISSVNIELADHSTFTGSINENSIAQFISLKIDNSSTMELTNNIYVHHIELNIQSNKVENISGNGYNVFYNPDENPDLEARTYPLKNEGFLTPWNKPN